MPDIRLSLTPKIAIVGRPNVGKSTFFNRLLGERKAITSSVPGTTTDANYGSFNWIGLEMTAIDTAGLDLTSEGATEDALVHQAELAIKKADLIVFIVEGGTPNASILVGDRAIAKKLQKCGKPVLLAMAKADNPRLRYAAQDTDWMKLGFGQPMPFSGVNGSGVGDLLDEAVKILREKGLDSQEIPKADLRMAIIGRPNVGKSSLLNALAGEQRVIVSEVPHTTKEPQDTLLTYQPEDGGTPTHVLAIDTVGIRKKSKVGPGLEKLGVHLTLEALGTVDVVVLIIGAGGGIGVQEKKLTDLVAATTAGILVVVNKWDIAAEKKLGTAEDYALYVRANLPYLSWADIVFVSAASHKGVGQIMPRVIDIAQARKMEIPQERLDAFVEKLKRMHGAKAAGENRPKVYGITQIHSEPPEFMLVAKDKDTIHPNFLHYVANRIRDEFGFAGTRIRVAGRELSKGALPAKRCLN
jgi:GTP-binding protein